nr:cathepsin B-like protease 3 [Solanum lycopersicum]
MVPRGCWGGGRVWHDGAFGLLGGGRVWHDGARRGCWGGGRVRPRGTTVPRGCWGGWAGAALGHDGASGLLSSTFWNNGSVCFTGRRKKKVIAENSIFQAKAESAILQFDKKGYSHPGYRILPQFKRKCVNKNLLRSKSEHFYVNAFLNVELDVCDAFLDASIFLYPSPLVSDRRYVSFIPLDTEIIPTTEAVGKIAYPSRLAEGNVIVSSSLCTMKQVFVSAPVKLYKKKQHLGAEEQILSQLLREGLKASYHIVA